MPDKSAVESGGRFRPASTILWWMVLGFAVVLLTLAVVLAIFVAGNFFYAEFALTIVVVASLMVLLLALAAAAIIFRRLGLANRNHAMGLPEGSIRAIIALLLILIFSVVAVFLITNTDRVGERVFERITQSQAEDFAADGTVLRWETLDETDDGGDNYVRLVMQGDAPLSSEMSQQLLTTLGTLVVAVASFYFGSQVVLTATTDAKTRKESDTEKERLSTGPDEGELNVGARKKTDPPPNP